MAQNATENTRSIIITKPEDFCFFYCFSVWEMSIEPQEHQTVSDRWLFLLFLLFPARGTGLLLLLKFLLLLPDAIISLLWCVYSLLLQFIPPKISNKSECDRQKKNFQNSNNWKKSSNQLTPLKREKKSVKKNWKNCHDNNALYIIRWFYTQKKKRKISLVGGRKKRRLIGFK